MQQPQPTKNTLLQKFINFGKSIFTNLIKLISHIMLTAGIFAVQVLLFTFITFVLISIPSLQSSQIIYLLLVLLITCLLTMLVMIYIAIVRLHNTLIHHFSEQKRRRFNFYKQQKHSEQSNQA